MTKKKKNRNEAGFAGIVVMFAIFGILVLCIGYATKRQSALQAQGQLSSTQANKWRAKSYLAQVDRAIQVKMPQYFVSDAASAKACRRDVLPDLKVFDSVEVPADSSNPAARLVNGTIVCSPDESSEKTSLLGNPGIWAEAHYQQIMAAANVFGEPSVPVTIVSISESVRRFSPTVDEPIYQLRYLLQATIELDIYPKQNDIVLALDGATCGTSASLRAQPETVERGQAVTFTIDYTLAANLQILNSSDQIIFEQNVTEEIPQRSIDFQFTPTVTDSYRVLSSGSGGCSAVSATIRVIVTDAPVVCPTLTLAASQYLINSGEPVDIIWETTNAAVVRLENTVVSANGTQNYILTGDRTFTAFASDSGNVCPQTRQVSIRVIQPSPTPTATPTILPTPTPLETPTPTPTPTETPTPSPTPVVPVLPSPGFGCVMGGYGGVSLVHTLSSNATSIVSTAMASIEPDGRIRVVACAGGASFGGYVTTTVTVVHPSLTGVSANWHSNGNPRQFGNPVYFNIPAGINPSDLNISANTTSSDGRGGGVSGICRSTGNTVEFTPVPPNGGCSVGRR